MPGIVKFLKNKVSAMKSWLLSLQLLFSLNPAYTKYVLSQLKRTNFCRNFDPKERNKWLIEKLSEIAPAPAYKSVLAIGSRNKIEIDCLKEKKYEKVTGIDLVSNHPGIMVMDMHKMSFSDGSFDIVYCAHSLEHAFDAGKAAKEIIRVARNGAIIAIEIPVKYSTDTVDLIDFKNSNNLLGLFRPALKKVFWNEEQPAKSQRNITDTAVVRTIFSITKNGK